MTSDDNADFPEVSFNSLDYQTEFLPKIKEYLKHLPDEALQAEIARHEEIRRTLGDAIADDERRSELIQVDGHAKGALQKQLRVLDGTVEKLRRSVKPQRLRNAFVEQIIEALEGETVESVFLGELKASAIYHAFRDSRT